MRLEILFAIKILEVFLIILVGNVRKCWLLGYLLHNTIDILQLNQRITKHVVNVRLVLVAVVVV